MIYMNRKSLVTGLGAGLSAFALSAAAKHVSRKVKQSLEPRLPLIEANDLVLYQFDYSPFCIKVRYCLQFKQLAFQTVDLTPLVHTGFSRALSGQTKVPYLQHGQQMIADSTAIALYLEDLQPGPSYLPADARQRESVLLLEDWLDEVFQPALARRVYLELAMHPQRAIQDPNLKTGIAALEPLKPVLVPLILKRSLKRQGIHFGDLDDLEQRLQTVLQQVLRLLNDQPFLKGGCLTLADLTLAAHLSSADRLPHLLAQPELEPLFAWRDMILASLPGA